MLKKSKGVKETRAIAKNFLRKLKPQKKRATIVGLYGELGAGKTTFTQFIAKELKIKRGIKSPTFVVLRRYPLNKNAHFKNLFHLDAYRFKNEKELLSLGWDEIISDKKHLIFIEWPENVIGVLPKKHQKIYISHGEKGQRNFKIKKG
jgi:tRNA threonylcarbamoyladenosine biosynthesis protein TsaE